MGTAVDIIYPVLEVTYKDILLFNSGIMDIQGILDKTVKTFLKYINGISAYA